MTLADCTVLVVEDHEFQRRTILQILANLGAGQLLEAADGERALTLLGGPPRADIIICDLDMPGMDGVEFLRHVSERSVDTAIVIASGLDDSVLRSAETTARAYGLQVLGAIRKPLTARRLLEVVGLHRPRAPRTGPPANGAQTDAWAAALATGAVDVVVRPRIDLLSGRLAGLQVQALRVADSGEAVGAATDLAVSAPVAVTGALADLLVDAACDALDALAADAPGLDATLLLPPAAVADLALADRLAGRAALAGVLPARLCVALPREPAVPDVPERLDALTRLRVRGFGLGLDGFTAGEPTLAGRAGVPLTEVALAPEAIADAGTSRLRVEALEATIRTLREQGARVVAAGCDTEAERDMLAQAGCDRAQGRAVGPPLALATPGACACAPG